MVFLGVAAALLQTFVVFACNDSLNNGDDDDDSAGHPSGDDDDNDDTAASCATLAGWLATACGEPLQENSGSKADQADLAAWCVDSEHFLGSPSLSPFWACCAKCATESNCSSTCFNNCIWPGDPGGSGCQETAYHYYYCGIISNYSNTGATAYWIPLMDLEAVCASENATLWNCNATCVADNPCSSPPTSAQTQALLNCLNNC
jgi:hypothetical protein